MREDAASGPIGSATGPDGYVVEEFLPLSHAPVWHEDRLESRALMLRVFLLTDGRGDYRLMPGGLSRIAGADRQIVSGQRGGSSKDTWVLSDVPVEPAPPVERRATHREAAGELTTSSRAAENLFWLGRYAERSENSARLLRAVLGHLTDDSTLPGRAAAGLPPGVRAAATPGAARRRTTRRTRADVGRRDGEPGPRAHRRHLRSAPQTQPGLQHRADGSRRRRRARPSVDRQLASPQSADAAVHGRTAAPADLDDALELIDDSLVALVAVGGLEMAHMTRDDGWRFLSLGRHLERLRFVATTLDDVALEQASADSAILEWLLELSDSLLTYRVRHMQHPEWQSVVDLVLFDERHPRSARFQLAKLAKHVRLLPDANLIEVLSEVDQLLDACRAVDEGQGELFGGERRSISCCGMPRSVLRVSDALTLRYFSHVDDLPRATVAV